MKHIQLLILSLVLLCSCKKAIEQHEENAVVKVMTDGQWKVTSFTSNDSDLTLNFNNYKFQYFADNTVNAIQSGVVQATGAWQGDVPTKSIYAVFQNAPDPLLLLNGTWKITDSGWTYVVATMTLGSEVRSLRLDKQ